MNQEEYEKQQRAKKEKAFEADLKSGDKVEQKKEVVKEQEDEN